MKSLKILSILLLFILLAKNINGQSVGGTTSGQASYCPGSNSGFLTLSGHTGAIIEWETSTDNGTTWITTGNTFTNQSYFNLSVTTCYRVIVQNGAFSPDTSTTTCITIYNVTTPQITQIGDTLISSTAFSYQWYMNGNTLTNETNQTLTLTQNGNYTVQINDNNDCSASSADYSVSGLQLQALNNDILRINYYPNPTSGLLQIALPLDAKLEYTIEISNSVGKIMFEEKNTAAASLSKELDLSKLPNGIYVLTIEDSNKTKYVQRIVLNK